MAVPRNQPYPGMNFVVDLGTGQVDGPDAGLLEVVFPEARLQVLEYRNGNDPENEVRKTQTVSKYTDLTLKRGVIGSLSWYTWWNSARNGDPTVVRTVTVTLLSEDHTQAVLKWTFVRARPVSHRFSPLNALGTEPLTECLEVAFERLEME
ncbi:MAG TPA: phage tail protein [Candidatus Saccharimonadales bacterium]|nr:phage tail protein [Candidatus Saccharimonadales bacterium]